MKPEIQALGIVLLGSFNPKIFHPAWFAANGLIGKLEGDAIEVEILTSDITVLHLDWLRLETTQNRFTATTEQEPYFEALQDLVVGTFDLLNHTPVHSLGINHSCHFRMKSEEDWHKFGHMLAPKEPWDGILEKPGMLRTEMRGIRNDGCLGNIKVRVEPSARVDYGVYIHVNDHYEIRDKDNVMGCNEIIDILNAHKKKSIDRARDIADLILKKSGG